MYRKNGKIPKIKNSSYPKDILVFDTESYKGVIENGTEYQSLRLGVSRYIQLDKDDKIDYSEYVYFDTVECLYKHITSVMADLDRLYVYAHNLKYDLQLSGLLLTLLSDNWEIEAIVIEDPPTFMRLKKDDKTLWLVDTFNYWQFSLEKMGIQLGYNKLKMPMWESDNKDWFEYCKRDVDVLVTYLVEFIHFLRDNDLSPLGLTIASQAFRSFRHRFMNTDIEIHNREDVIEYERDSYKGGRVECFYIGMLEGSEFYKLDVNSMYPYVMSKYEYPVKLVGHTKDITLARLYSLMTKYYVIANVSITTDENCFAYRYNDKLVFPNGSYDVTLHHSELEYAKSKGMIDGCNVVMCYEKGKIFGDYVKYFHNIKLEAEKNNNPVQRQLAKIFLNSLYGKFGQLGYETIVTENNDDNEYSRYTGYSEKLGKRVTILTLGSYKEIRYSSGESNYSFPAIAGSVTANARMYLYSMMLLAGKENVYYVDTDSLFVNKEGYENLKNEIIPHVLGKLNIEDTSENIRIYGSKDYEFGAVIKHKGIPQRNIVIDENTFEYQQFMGSKTWANGGFETGVEIYTKIKRRISQYDKGIVSSFGTVIPHRFIRE